jgi:hemerythrin-like metal-binding protein
MTPRAPADQAAVGFDDVDGEHRVQLGLLEALRGAVAAGRAIKEQEEVLVQLVDYTKVHFASELLLMRLYAYPQYQAHSEEHDETLERLEELQQRLAAGDLDLTLEALDRLEGWLVGHIRRADRAFGGYRRRLAAGRD